MQDESSGPATRRGGSPPRAGAHVDQRLAPALGELNSAATDDEVGEVVATHAAALWAARGAAVAVVEGAALRLTGAVGYDCDTMAPGARLPMTAGLPLTEAARTGDPVILQAAGGGGWVAVPLPGAPRPLGSLVLSLTVGGPAVDVGLLSELAHHASRALRRVRTSAPPVPMTGIEIAGLDIAVHHSALSGRIGGDVVAVVPDRRGGCWLLVADVCGADVEARRAARDLHLVACAVAPLASGPAALLQALDSLLRDTVVTDRFATALALRLVPNDGGGWRLDIAVAGHPLPAIVHRGDVRPIGSPGLPLNLETVGESTHRPEMTLELARGDLLVAGTDGVTDRVRGGVPDDELAAAIIRGVAAGESAAERLRAILADLAATHGNSRDDLSAVLVSVL
jgi:hypothetical protein